MWPVVLITDAVNVSGDKATMPRSSTEYIVLYDHIFPAILLYPKE